MKVLSALFGLGFLGVAVCREQDGRDVSQVFGRSRLNSQSLLVLPSDDGRFFFVGNEWPIVFRHDLEVRRDELIGERVFASLLHGPVLRTSTTSQSRYLSTLRPMPQLRVGSQAIPIAAPSQDRLFVHTVSAGYGPARKDGRVRHLFGVSLIRFKERGQRPNTDAEFPRDVYGWYSVVDLQVRNAGEGELFAAHTLGRDPKRTVLESYFFGARGLKRVPSGEGHFAKLNGRSISNDGRIPPRSARATPNDMPPLAVDAANVRFARCARDTVTETDLGSGKSITLALPRWQLPIYIGGELVVTSVTSPGRRYVYKSFRLDRLSRRWRQLGDFRIAGISPDRSVWVIQTQDHKYCIGPPKVK